MAQDEIIKEVQNKLSELPNFYRVSDDGDKIGYFNTGDDNFIDVFIK